jgi:integrase
MTGALRHELASYLALRRAMGYQMARPEKLLGQFLDFLDSYGQTRITVAAALDWARLPASTGTSNWWAYRLSAVRGFATYLHALDPKHEVPAANLLPQRTHRACPYLYSGADIAALIAATDTLRTELRRATFATLIGLLAVTGVRVGEALALDRDDIDLRDHHQRRHVFGGHPHRWRHGDRSDHHRARRDRRRHSHRHRQRSRD